MECSATILQASYAACRRVGRRARSNLYFGFPWFSGEQRQAMDALYAFARLTDDLADSDLPADLRRRQLAAWRKATQEALTSGGGGSLTGRGGAFPREADETMEAHGFPPSVAAAIVLPALGDMVQRFSVPPQHLFALIDGAEMDLNRCRYETLEELEGYCRCVASAIGLACIHIWGYRSDRVFALAERCGIALQWTNILRDVKEDMARDRVYLPQRDLRKHQITETDLRGAADARFNRLMTELVERGHDYYREGVDVLRWLDPAGRRVCGLMIDRYWTLLNAIGRHPEVVLQRRVSLPRLVKVRLALRWLLRGRTATPRNAITESESTLG
ncbi:MAG: squalene/phytoene synthase family protein [Patescibacteria group bacterium]|nr:squalene/phytoene synthase family protein [Patescibacteria group bacterium]